MNGFDLSTISKLYFGSHECSAIYLGSSKIWPTYTPIPVGTIFNFDYTGTVQSQLLAPGAYKLQCWGAQGGLNPAYSAYNIVSIDGGKGGYSEGILVIESPTTVYVFVGGLPSTSSTDGGWNGGGGGTGSSQAGVATDTNGLGYTSTGRGGGATDIALVTSTMSYSNYRTNRSSASLLSRFIVAGGGSGGAMCYKENVTTVTSWEKISTTIDYSLSTSGTTVYWDGYRYTRTRTTSSATRGHTAQINFQADECPLVQGHYKVVWSGITQNSVATSVYWSGVSPTVSILSSTSVTGVTTVEREFDFTYDAAPSSAAYLRFQVSAEGSYFVGTLEIYKQVSSSETVTENNSQVGFSGGGIEGDGYTNSLKGTQTSAGTNAGFGYGRSQPTTSYRFVGACGGGGWYGGGSNYGNANIDNMKYSGGGSGFVNIAANAASRPENYTGVELLEGTTYAGNTSFLSTSGNTETGHEGNGYARITCVDINLYIPLTFDVLDSGTITWKTSGSSLTRTIQYKKNDGAWTSITSSTAGVNISVSAGDVIQFIGDNTGYGNSSYYNGFASTCFVNIRGNVMSLINSTSFNALTSLSTTYAFRALFTALKAKDASQLAMPATTLTNYCYQYMFYNGSSAGTLEKAPTLPALTLTDYCYRGMYQGNPNLTYIKCLATDRSASNCTNNWVSGVSSTGTFVKNSAMSSWPSGNSGIPNGWTVQNATL